MLECDNQVRNQQMQENNQIAENWTYFFFFYTFILKLQSSVDH